MAFALFKYKPKSIGQKKSAYFPASAKRFFHTYSLVVFKANTNTIIPNRREVAKDSFLILLSLGFLSI